MVILEELETVVSARVGADAETSYSARLLSDPELVQRKIMEEAFEVCLELGRSGDAATFDRARVAEEAADLLYYLVVGLVGVGVELDDVFSVLNGRRK